MTRDELIAKLEGLSGPDRGMDLEIARLLAWDVICLRYNTQTGMNEAFVHWEYTGKVDDAIALTERLLPGWSWLRLGRGVLPTHNYAILRKYEEIGESYIESKGQASSLPIALLIALLRALEENGKTEAAE